MYKEFYGLKTEPFCLDPDLGFLFLSHAHEEAVGHIVYGLQQEETIILITGDIGTGKTLAVHRVVGQLSATFQPIIIGITTLDFLQFVRMVLFKLGEETPPVDLSGALARLERILLDLRSHNRKLVLIVDEAQNCEAGLLESIRLLLNLAQPGGQVLQLILVGQIGLESTLALPELRQLQQRIRVSYRLSCLDRRELDDYVNHRLEVAGRSKTLFSGGALDRIFDLSGGVPRLVNQYASRALLTGFVENARTIESRHVEDDADARPVADTGPRPRSAPSGSELPAAPASASAPAPTPIAAVQAPSPVAPSRGASDFAQRRPRQSFRWLVAAILLLTLAAVAAVTRDRWLPALTARPGVKPQVEGATAPARTSAEVADSTPTPLPSSEANAANDTAGALAVGATRAESPVADDTRPQSVDATPNPALRNEPQRGPVERPTPPITTPAAGAGTSQTVESLTPVDSPKRPATDSTGTAPATAVSGGPLSIHVFSFLVPDRAETSLARLHADGLSAFIVHEPGPNERIWYRVYLGPVVSRQRAEALVDSLTAAGVISYHAYSHRMPGDS